MAGRLSKEDNPAKFPKYYKPLSRRLYKVLEEIGASTELRDLRTKAMTTCEIRQTMVKQLETETNNSMMSSGNSRVIETDSTSLYICGSSFEGTKTDGLDSDVDYLIVQEFPPVVTDILDAQIHNCCLLMVQDVYTQPGYVKLQWVSSGVPQFVSSAYPRLLSYFRDLEYRKVYTISAIIGVGEERHGPARSSPKRGNVSASDSVIAQRCRNIPHCASEWFTRQRLYNWPTAELIDKCRTLGCFVVCVGHPNSQEKHIQWRLSFTLQERLLVTQFNSVQFKCYILMKIIKKDIIYKHVGEKSLSSYHCKTIILYLIENTPLEFWRKDNLLVCLYTCLSKILTCVENMACPNYFIPDENMFDGRLNGEIQTKLCKVLRNILSADFHFLSKLKTDDLGERLQDAVSGVQCRRLIYHVDLIKPYIANYQMRGILYHRIPMLQASLNSDSDTAVASRRLNWLISRLQNTQTVTEHTREQTQNALSPVCQYIEISHMSVGAVLAKCSHKGNVFLFQTLTSEKWHLISLESDQFSSILKQASLLYMMEFPEVSLDVLLNLEQRLRHQRSLCTCSEGRDSSKKFSMEDHVSFEGNTPEEQLYNYWIPCVIYLPAEKDLTPTAICYEMNRSLGFSDDNREDWYDWAIVDGKILLYFLLYLNHRHFGMEAHAAADMENIRWLIETDRFLGHRETALNLLGWIYKDRGRVDRAVECFRESIFIQRTHNAAFLHMKDIENVLRIFLSSRFTVT